MNRLRKAAFSPMNRLLTAIVIVLAGAGVRMAIHSGNRGLFSHPQVDELEYMSMASAPFQRPPGTYILARLPRPRLIFGGISLLPSLLFFLFLPRSRKHTLFAGLLALEPTLALSGIQVLPEAPAAALVAAGLVCFRRGENRLAGFLFGASALFRGELLLLLPLLPLTGKRGLTMALFAASAVLPVMAVNAASGAGPTVAATGGVNLWIGSDWELITTPPGVEFEQLMELSGEDTFTRRALNVISRNPSEWVLRGLTKTLAFFSLPGPGRNIDSGAALAGVFPLLAITALFLAGASGIRRNPSSAFIFAALASAFLFFPSVRYRAVFLPAFALTALDTPWKKLLPGVAAVAAASLLINYPGHVRPGLNSVLSAQNALRDNRPGQCLESLALAEREGYWGADLHNIRASAMAMMGMDFQETFLEFGRALEAAPRSPTVWRNTAAFLWNTGRVPMAREAAEKAVSLNPALRGELESILSE